jgi:hypothetical protein
MVHTKIIKRDTCRFDNKNKWKGCWAAHPWLDGKAGKKDVHDADGMECNCFINETSTTSGPLGSGTPWSHVYSSATNFWCIPGPVIILSFLVYLLIS